MAINEDLGWVPESCSLPTAERPLRRAEFDEVFRESVVRFARTSVTRLDLALAADAEETARELAERESGCCSFFDFQFSQSGADVVMSVNVPDSQADVLDALVERLALIHGER